MIHDELSLRTWLRAVTIVQRYSYTVMVIDIQGGWDRLTL
jgi:hypothetical protein